MLKISRKTAAIFVTLCAVVVVGYLSVLITVSFVDKSSSSMSPNNPSGTQTESRYSRLDEVFNMLMSEYYKAPDEAQLIQGAIDGMLESLGDPYTFYYTPEEMTKATQDHNGLYTGVGMLVTSDAFGRLEVLRVFKDSPAKHAGILPGDVIIESDGMPVSAETVEIMNESVARIKGSVGTFVNLTILRKDERLNLNVERNNVIVNRVEYTILEGNVGYLLLYDFFGDAESGVKEAFDAFKAANVNGVIFDLRSNPGGLMDICLKISDMVLPEGLIVYTEDRNGKRDYSYSDASRYDIPLVVLVNGHSASASEIFAAAVQDHKVGVIVGETTYGKGVVQTQHGFTSDGAGVQLTTSSYFTPSGRSIHGNGVVPDIIVELSPDYDTSVFGVNMQNDNQLKAAFDEVMRMAGK